MHRDFFGKLALPIAGLFWSAIAQGEATVTAEKNCNVRIEGDEFKAGDRVVLFREKEGKKKRLAIVEIAKTSGQKRALGRVVKGPTVCGGLKGAFAEIEGGKGESSMAASSLGSRMDAQVGVGISLFDQKSMAYPGRVISSGSGRLQAASVSAKFDVFPLAFSGNRFIERMVGLSCDVGYASLIPARDIPTADGEIAGKLTTTALDVRVDLALRAIYLEDKIISELRFSPYVLRDVKQQFAGDNKSDTPFANINVTGMGIGFVQRFRIGQLLRVNAGGMYGLGLKGSSLDVMGGGTVPTSTASGYSADLSVDYVFSKLKLFGLFRMEEFSGSGIAVDADNVETKYKIAANKYSILAGLGLLL